MDLSNKHFGPGLAGLAKMSATLARASASSELGGAKAKEAIADTYFHGNQVDATRAMEMFSGIRKASVRMPFFVLMVMEA